MNRDLYKKAMKHLSHDQSSHGKRVAGDKNAMRARMARNSARMVAAMGGESSGEGNKPPKKAGKRNPVSGPVSVKKATGREVAYSLPLGKGKTVESRLSMGSFNIFDNKGRVLLREISVMGKKKMVPASFDRKREAVALSNRMNDDPELLNGYFVWGG